VTRVLALDIGTSSARAHVFDSTAAESGEPARRDYHGETDPDALVRTVREVLAEARADDVDAIAASCFGHSLLALDEQGRPLTPLLGWRDTRSAESAEWLARRLDGEAVQARTGCALHSSFWPAKLAWLAEVQPEAFRAAARFVSFPDYLYAQLLRTDDVPVSRSVASGTGLFDVHALAWDAELLDALGIDEAKLSRIADDPLGEWHPARIDGACSNLGAGCVGRRRAALMVGTSGALRTLYETDVAQPRRGLFLYRLDGRRVVEGGALSDGGNLHHWIRDTVKDPQGSLAGRDPASHGLTFLTMLGGERSPGWHPAVRGAIHGLTFETSTLDLLQAALEGVAFRFADVLDLMPEVQEIVATGGALLRDDDWCQIMADALARPIVASGVKEASLRGAAVLVLELLGEEPPEPPLGKTYEPRAEHADAYRDARERQRELYRVATVADTS
jgi:gluconokinase